MENGIGYKLEFFKTEDKSYIFQTSRQIGVRRFLLPSVNESKNY